MPVHVANAAAQRRHYDKSYAWLREQKDRPCMDCGGYWPDNPEVMDFDHRPGEVKLFGINSAASRRARHLLEAEIAKCDLVCANCHRIRTRSRLGVTVS